MRKKIGIIGRGEKSLILSKKLVKLGYDVRTDSLPQPYRKTSIVNFAEIILTWEGQSDNLKPLNPKQLKKKIILDFSTIEDRSGRRIHNTSFNGRQKEKSNPSLNIVHVYPLSISDMILDPNESGDDASLFVIGNNPYVKQQIIELLNNMGIKGIIEIKNPSEFENTELMVPSWVQLNLIEIN